MKCPHCKQPLSPEQITKLWAQLSASKRKVKTGGKNGGRPKRSEPAAAKRWAAKKEGK